MYFSYLMLLAVCLLLVAVVVGYAVLAIRLVNRRLALAMYLLYLLIFEIRIIVAAAMLKPQKEHEIPNNNNDRASSERRCTVGLNRMDHS